jgi:hypothetical protein
MTFSSIVGLLTVSFFFGLHEFVLKTALGGIVRPKAISAFSGRFANVEIP